MHYNSNLKSIDLYKKKYNVEQVSGKNLFFIKKFKKKIIINNFIKYVILLFIFEKKFYQ